MRRMLVVGLCPLLGAFLGLTGCGGALPVSSPQASVVTQTVTAPPAVDPTTNRGTQDEQFLALLRQYGFFYSGNDQDLIDVAQTICSSLGAGISGNQLMQMAVQSGFTPDDAATLIAASVVTYCPWNRDAVA